MTDDVEIVPAKPVGQRNRIGGDLRHGVVAGLVARMAVAADVDEGVGEALRVEVVEHRFERAMIAEPAVDDRDLDGPVAELLVKDHRVPASLLS